MHILPPELLHKIFALCCTDVGRTGRALSLVSHYIHDVSEPYRLHSVALAGARDITAFAAYLHTVPPHVRRTRNLLVSDCASWSAKWTTLFDEYGAVPNVPHGGAIGDPLKFPDHSSNGRGHPATLILDDDNLFRRPHRRPFLTDYQTAEDRAKRDNLIASRSSEQATVRAAVESILALLAPTLRTLTLFVASPAFPRCALPALEDLTVQYLQGRHLPADLRFPALRRLHVAHYTRSSADAARIAALAPALACLRLSGVCQDAELPQRLAGALGVREHGGAEAVLRGLTRLLLRPMPRSGSVHWVPAEIAHDRTIAGLLALQDEDPLGRVEVLEARQSQGGCTYEEVLADWEDWVAGGDGCWIALGRDDWKLNP